MNIQDVMLRDILDNPADDGGRLIYADFLADNGYEERAEFIRAQIEYAILQPHHEKHTTSLRHPSYCMRCIRAEELSHLIRTRFAVSINKPASFATDCPYRSMKLDGYTGPRIDWDWHRGFVHTVRMPMQAWLDHGKKLVMAHPIEKVVLNDRRARRRPWDSGANEWGWYNGGFYRSSWEGGNQEDLQEDIWDQLTGYRPFDNWKNYQVEHLALYALSKACLAWAK